MRTGLVVGIGLALVLATVLWWVVDRRLERLVPPADAQVAAPAPAEATLVAPDAVDLAADRHRVDATNDEPLNAGARPIRGLLRDGHCGPPITGGVRLELSSRIGPVTEVVEPGPDGSFATTRAFEPGAVLVRVLEARSGEELFEEELTFDPAEPVWTLWAHLGLVIPLELTGVDVGALAEAKVHVVQENHDEPRSWISRPLLGGEHPFVHYTSLIQRLEGARSARLELEIESPGGPSFRGSASLVTTHGVHPTVSIAVEEETRAFGRVVDEQGLALDQARVWLLPAAPAAPLDERSLGRRARSASESGAFSFREIEPGPQLLRACADGRASTARRVLLHGGMNDLGTIVLPLAGGVPPGDLENRASEVSAADQELRLLAIGDDGLRFARFDLACRVGGRWHSGWLLAEGNVPLQAERYLVSCRGYRPRFVDDGDFVPSPDGEARVARVELERGWSASLVFLDVEEAPMGGGKIDPNVAPPLAGVRVIADDRQVAISDADGLALVSLEGAPSQLTFDIAGRRVLAIDDEHGLRFVWMIRE